ncbi:MAG: hypothetical protein K9J17_06795 [Flavobacteriales bacterium]|nr:hypothetical protein [Flavobacteriales bacterium]
MKTNTLSFCLATIAIIMFSNPKQATAQANCDYPTRFCCDFYIDLPAGFTGEKTQSIYPKKKATITAEKCEGPFKVVITNQDGSTEAVKIYERSTATSDTMYIEQPEPPYDLQMFVQMVYGATEIK